MVTNTKENKQKFLDDIKNGIIQMEYRIDSTNSENEWINAKNMPEKMKKYFLEKSFFSPQMNGFSFDMGESGLDYKIRYLPNSPKFEHLKITFPKDVYFVSLTNKKAIMIFGNTYPIKYKLSNLLGFTWTKMNWKKEYADLPPKIWIIMDKNNNYKNFFEFTNVTWDDILTIDEYYLVKNTQKQEKNIGKEEKTTKKSIVKNPVPLPQNYKNYNDFDNAYAYYLATDAKNNLSKSVDNSGNTSTWLKAQRRKSFDYFVSSSRGGETAKKIWKNYELSTKISQTLANLKQILKNMKNK